MDFYVHCVSKRGSDSPEVSGKYKIKICDCTLLHMMQIAGSMTKAILSGKTKLTNNDYVHLCFWNFNPFSWETKKWFWSEERKRKKKKKERKQAPSCGSILYIWCQGRCCLSTRCFYFLLISFLGLIKEKTKIHQFLLWIALYIVAVFIMFLFSRKIADQRKTGVNGIFTWFNWFYQISWG